MLRIKVGSVVTTKQGIFGPVEAVVTYADRTEYRVGGSDVDAEDVVAVYRQVVSRAAKPRTAKKTKKAPALKEAA